MAVAKRGDLVVAATALERSSVEAQPCGAMEADMDPFRPPKKSKKRKHHAEETGWTPPSPGERSLQHHTLPIPSMAAVAPAADDSKAAKKARKAKRRKDDGGAGMSRLDDPTSTPDDPIVTYGVGSPIGPDASTSKTKRKQAVNVIDESIYPRDITHDDRDRSETRKKHKKKKKHGNEASIQLNGGDHATLASHGGQQRRIEQSPSLLQHQQLDVADDDAHLTPFASPPPLSPPRPALPSLLGVSIQADNAKIAALQSDLPSLPPSFFISYSDLNAHDPSTTAVGDLAIPHSPRNGMRDDIAVDPSLPGVTNLRNLLKDDADRFKDHLPLPRVTAEEVDEARRLSELDTRASRAKPRLKSKKAPNERDRVRNARLLSEVAGMSHADILATKWLENAQLNLLEEKIGLFARSGRFTQSEDVLIQDSVQKYQKRNRMDDVAFLTMMNSTDKGQSSANKAFFSEVCRNVGGGRPVHSVAHRVKRLYELDARKGKWTDEEDERLRQAYQQYGGSWDKVSRVVGRSPNDARDRWRNILSSVGTRETKHTWNQEEEYALHMAVKKVAKENGIDILTTPNPDISWSAVSKELNGRRTRLSCANRWTDLTYRMLIGRGKLENWTSWDTYQLVNRMHELNFSSQDSVTWIQLPHREWCRWSGTNLRKQYQRILRKSVVAKNCTDHRSAVEALYADHVEGKDPDKLDKPDHSSYIGLEELPDVPLECYGAATRRLWDVTGGNGPGYRPAHRRRDGENIADHAVVDSEIDNVDISATLESAYHSSPFKSSAIIEDSDEEAAV